MDDDDTLGRGHDHELAADPAPKSVGPVTSVLMRFAVRSLPARDRGRYLEEFCAELQKLPDGRQLFHAWRIFRSSGRLGRELRPKQQVGLFVPVVAAIAVLMIVVSSLGLAAREAQPGDTLWPLTQLLYADYSRSVESSEAVRADLQDAHVALRDGRISDVVSSLEDAHSSLPVVTVEDGQSELESRHASLVAMLPGTWSVR